MALPNIFTTEATSNIVNRINKLTAESKPLFGKMAVAQMLAHCNVAYEMVYDNIHPAPNAFVKFILKALLKKKIVSEEPYKQNGKTAPQFIITTDKDFEIEKNRLIAHINKTQQLGETHFNGKESHSFGPLTSTEWNNMFYKHLNHHLGQFAV
jgi:Protein of unknown function (DUF1569)